MGNKRNNMLQNGAILILILTLPGVFLQALAQNKKQTYNYNDHVFYRSHGYLNTPYSYSLMANSMLGDKDTAGALHYVEQALMAGAYSNLFNTNTVAAVQPLFLKKHKVTIEDYIKRNQEKINDPQKLQVVTSDIKLFWNVFDKLHNKKAGEIFMKDYILKGSKGLQTFFLVRMSGNIHNYINEIKRKEKFYRSIRPLYNSIDSKIGDVYKAARQLQELYPPSIFPNIYLLVGMMTTGGTPDGGAGLLIGTELYSNSTTTDTAGLGSWEKSVIQSSDYLVPIVIHEYVHIQQKHVPTNALLGRVINEGGADFITQIISNKNINEHLHAYGNRREKELFELFEKEKNGTDFTNWLYNGGTAGSKGIPADLGYYLGFKICESYYNKASDKKQAIKDIMEIKDFEEFYKKSGYQEKFSAK